MLLACLPGTISPSMIFTMARRCRQGAAKHQEIDSTGGGSAVGRRRRRQLRWRRRRWPAERGVWPATLAIQQRASHGPDQAPASPAESCSAVWGAERRLQATARTRCTPEKLWSLIKVQTGGRALWDGSKPSSCGGGGGGTKAQPLDRSLQPPTTASNCSARLLECCIAPLCTLRQSGLGFVSAPRCRHAPGHAPPPVVRAAPGCPASSELAPKLDMLQILSCPWGFHCR